MKCTSQKNAEEILWSVPYSVVIIVIIAIRLSASYPPLPKANIPIPKSVHQILGVRRPRYSQYSLSPITQTRYSQCNA